MSYFCFFQNYANVEINTITMDNISDDNVISSTSVFNKTLPMYQIIWTGEVVFKVSMLIVVICCSLFGNTFLLLMIVCDRKQRRKRVNIFLVNLAIGNLVVCLFTMSTEILFVAFGEWILGAVACKVIVYGQIVTLASTTFLLTGMSIDRFQVIVRPLQAFRAQPSIWKKVLFAWVLAFLFAIPQLFIFVQTNEGVRPDGYQRHFCKSQGYTEKWQRKAYFTFLTTYILLIPTCIMSFCYLNIMRVVWKRMANDSGKNNVCKSMMLICVKSQAEKEKHVETVGSDPSAHRYHQRRLAVFYDSDKGNRHLIIPRRLVSSSKRKVVKMTFSVIIGFVVCWTPYFVVGLIRIYSDYRFKIETFLVVAEILALVHSALNPILYAVFFGKFTKRTIRKALSCIRKCGQTKHRRKSSKNLNNKTNTAMFEVESSTSFTNIANRFSLRRHNKGILSTIQHTFLTPTEHRNNTKVTTRAKQCYIPMTVVRNTKTDNVAVSKCAGPASETSISPPATPDHRRDSFVFMMEQLKSEANYES